ncbi:MAG: ABC transporter substrate-binding protein [Acetatifactor sp.]|nr:ABC transporter substrate-binding protein [Acetatifactor sp.]
MSNIWRKRIVQIILAGVSVLTACGTGQTGTSEGEPVTLIYGTMHLEQEMDTWIAEYNLAHEDCRIEVREYGQEGFEEGLLRLNAELVQGKGPDLLDLSDIDAGPYITLGILTDIYPLLEADSELSQETFMPGGLKLYETAGHLYGISPGYRLETVMGKKTVLGEPAEWTVEKMYEMIENLPDGGCFINNLGSLGLLRIVLHRGMDEYVDWESGTCDFDGDEFRELLRLAAAMDALPLLDDEEQAIAEGKLLANRLYVSCPEEYAESASLFQGEPVVCVGFPSAEGGGALITPYLPVGICRGENRDAAWEFVKSLLGNEFQEKHIRFNFPLRRDSLRKMLEESVARSAENGSGEENLSKDDCDALYEVIFRTDCSQVFDANIWKIVEEEAETFFKGDKSIEDAVRIIQSRAEVYIQENCQQSTSEPGSPADDGGLDNPAGETVSDTEQGAVITEEILQQCREDFFHDAEYEGLSEEETDILYQRLLDSRVMEQEEMRITGMAAGDYDGNGCTDMVVCLYSLAEDADNYRDGCLYLFMNKDEPCRIYEKSCCYWGGMLVHDFGADIDRDGKTEVIIEVQGTGNGGWGDICGFVVKYENPGIQIMRLPNNMSDYCGIEVTVEGNPNKGVYTAYCSELDEEIEFSADRAVDDMRGGNCRGYSLELGEYRGEEVLLGYEYLYAGGIMEYVGAAVFVIGWDESGSSYIRDWYIIGDDSLAQEAQHYARKAFETFLAGSILKFDSADIKRWRLDTWRKDILLLGGELEYAYLDLDGDGMEELLVQYKDSPETYNGVFHYEDGKLYCWQNDGMEGSCRDYPLRDGTMVRQYDYGDNSSYNLFRYQNDGSQTEISNLFVRNELLDSSSTDPCPYYEVAGKEVDESEFEKQLKALVTDRRLESSAWTILAP